MSQGRKRSADDTGPSGMARAGPSPPKAKKKMPIDACERAINELEILALAFMMDEPFSLPEEWLPIGMEASMFMGLVSSESDSSGQIQQDRSSERQTGDESMETEQSEDDAFNTEYKSLETMDDMMNELDEIESAMNVFGVAGEVCEKEWLRLLHCASLCDGQDAVKKYRDAILLMEEEHRRNETARNESVGCMGDAPQVGVTLADICAAYCAMAESYFQQRYWDPSAAHKSNDLLRRVLDMDPENDEALHFCALVLYHFNEREMAQELLLKSVHLWMAKCNSRAMESNYKARAIAANILILMGEHKLAVDVLTILLDEYQSDSYLLYMMGVSHFFQGWDHFQTAQKYLAKGLEVQCAPGLHRFNLKCSLRALLKVVEIEEEMGYLGDDESEEDEDVDSEPGAIDSHVMI